MGFNMGSGIGFGLGLGMGLDTGLGMGLCMAFGMGLGIRSIQICTNENEETHKIQRREVKR